jgi:phospholipase/lecithinase/hemolysin
MVKPNVFRAARWLLAASVVIAGWDGAAAIALTPSRLVVFGDSLSDIGNIDNATLGVVPGSHYYSGRFSNGPTWAERLALNLGVGPLLPSTDGGNDFAYGGAETSGANGIGGVFIRDLDEQLSDFRASRAVDPNALYVVWAGANDLFDGETNVNVPISRVVATLESLTALGARQFLVPNLPILGRIPEYNRDPAASTAFDQLSYQYNTAFAAAIDQLAASHLNATFYQLDVAELFSSAIAAPAAFGLTNVTDPAAPGLTPGKLFYFGHIVPHPEQYLFWDTIHPTTTIHGILGDVASRLVDGVPGDFNSNGKVDAADLALWRTGVGAANAAGRQGDVNGDGNVDGLDFLAWQRTLGTNLTGPPRTSASVGVPEPETVVLLAVGAGVLARTGRHRGRR